jgi:hypothetical protein
VRRFTPFPRKLQKICQIVSSEIDLTARGTCPLTHVEDQGKRFEFCEQRALYFSKRFLYCTIIVNLRLPVLKRCTFGRTNLRPPIFRTAFADLQASRNPIAGRYRTFQSPILNRSKGLLWHRTYTLDQQKATSLTAYIAN